VAGWGIVVQGGFFCRERRRRLGVAVVPGSWLIVLRSQEERLTSVAARHSCRGEVSHAVRAGPPALFFMRVHYRSI
jgi:hypothetical protein